MKTLLRVFACVFAAGCFGKADPTVLHTCASDKQCPSSYLCCSGSCKKACAIPDASTTTATGGTLVSSRLDASTDPPLRTGGAITTDSATGGTTGSGGVIATGGMPLTGGLLATGGALSLDANQDSPQVFTGGTVATGGVLRTGGMGATIDAPVVTGGAPVKLDAAVANGGNPPDATIATGGIIATGGTGVTFPTKFVGNITTRNTVDVAGLPFQRYWDQITPETAGLWSAVQTGVVSAFNWTMLDAIYDYAQKNNLVFKEHAFVYGSAIPSGVVTETHVRNWMKAFCERYPETKLIDVVNEPPPHKAPNYVEAIGGGTNGDWKWITNSFLWAKESCPKAILILNDYNNIEYEVDNTRFIDLTNKVVATGAPIHALGAQAHNPITLDKTVVKGFLDKLNQQTGLPIYITEFDIALADDTAQLDKYRDYLSLFMETNYVKGITIWGWQMGATWVNNSGLVTTGNTFRPAMTWLMGYLGRPTTP